MFRCDDCKSVFSEPEGVEICYEDYYGVSSMFSDSHYGTLWVCPECGSEEIEECFEEDDDE